MYQGHDANHFQLYNSTEDTWVSSSIPGHPIAASGVSLSTEVVRDYPSQLRLFYQIASGNLVVADWLSLQQFNDASTVASILPHLLLFRDLLLI